MIQNHRQRILAGLLSLVLVWGLGWAGFRWAHGRAITPESVLAYLHSQNFSQLTGADRARALHELARQLNALNLKDRRQVRLDKELTRWFNQMTETERSDFIEETLPTGFQQMLQAFEKMPEDQRKRAIEQSLANLRREQRNSQSDGGSSHEPSIELSPQLQKKAITLGLQSFYSQSSAQTKAEMAPVLEEMQRLMERGVRFGPRRGFHDPDDPDGH